MSAGNERLQNTTKQKAVSHKVMGMWLAYYEAYQDKAAEEKAHLEIQKDKCKNIDDCGRCRRSVARRLYRMIPLVGMMYKSFGKHKKECMAAFEQSEKEIINWLR